MLTGRALAPQAREALSRELSALRNLGEARQEADRAELLQELQVMKTLSAGQAEREAALLHELEQAKRMQAAVEGEHMRLVVALQARRIAALHAVHSCTPCGRIPCGAVRDVRAAWWQAEQLC